MHLPLGRASLKMRKVSFAFSSADFKSTQTTSAPCSNRLKHIPRPMPEAAPFTIATRFRMPGKLSFLSYKCAKLRWIRARYKLFTICLDVRTYICREKGQGAPRSVGYGLTLCFVRPLCAIYHGTCMSALSKRAKVITKLEGVQVSWSFHYFINNQDTLQSH